MALRTANGMLSVVPSLRVRQRVAVRERLTDAAYDLVFERGFDGATVEAIAERAGVGRTTAFRHFPTKEDLLLGWLDEVRERLAASLAARPAGERPLPAIRAALLDLADVYVAQRERTLAVARLSVEVPSLRARYLERKRAWEDLLATDVARRLGVDEESDLRPRLVAQVCLSATSAATEHWLRGGGVEDLPTLVDRALATVEQGLGALEPRG